jgi:hypothetical protein
VARREDPISKEIVLPRESPEGEVAHPFPGAEHGMLGTPQCQDDDVAAVEASSHEADNDPGHMSMMLDGFLVVGDTHTNAGGAVRALELDRHGLANDSGNRFRGPVVLARSVADKVTSC